VEARAEAYQNRLEAAHVTPEGVLRYRRRVDRSDSLSYGNLADGCFHTGIYLASQAMRFAVTGDAAAREQAILALDGMTLLLEVTGKHGLLARHVSPAPSLEELGDDRWKRSTTRPNYVWRSDVSKDQYAGFIHGLGVALHVFDGLGDVEVRARIGKLAAAIADHLMANDSRIIDADGEMTTFGDLRARAWGFPKGVDALILLAVGKVAAVSNASDRYRDFFDDLVSADLPRIALAAHVGILGGGNRVNDHMGYLALYPLLLLEKDPSILADLRRSAYRSWSALRDDHNAFFAFIHAAVVAQTGDLTLDDTVSALEARRLGEAALGEFPDAKVEWPVDLTREGVDWPRAFLNGRDGYPRSQQTLPLYLRARGSSLWVSDPRRLVGRLNRRGEFENAGVDFLVAYWLARYHGLIDSDVLRKN